MTIAVSTLETQSATRLKRFKCHLCCSHRDSHASHEQDCHCGRRRSVAGRGLRERPRHGFAFFFGVFGPAHQAVMCARSSASGAIFRHRQERCSICRIDNAGERNAAGLASKLVHFKPVSIKARYAHSAKKETRTAFWTLDLVAS
jgi:hypothetical protein